MMKYTILILTTLLLILSSCSQNASTPVSMDWRMCEYDSLVKATKHQIVVRNNSSNELSNDWAIYYSQFYKEIIMTDSQVCTIKNINCNYFTIVPNERYKNLAAGDSVIITYYCNGITQNSEAPESAFFVSKKDNKPLPISLNNKKLPLPNDGVELFVDNEKYNNLIDSNITTISYFPSVKSIHYEEKFVKIPDLVTIDCEPMFNNEVSYLKESVVCKCKMTTQVNKNSFIKMSKLNVNDNNEEAYRISVNSDGVNLFANTTKGMFNAVQTFIQMLRKSDATKLKYVEILDYPDLEYRGMMYDIARSFTSKENLKRLIDALASYKINVLHLHFCDDEAWRIEIPGLEELTTVGANHGYDETKALFPSYDGCYDPENKQSSSNGFYTRADFVEILKFAKQRHIRVIPEIECPAHARAAIYSMKARYDKYKDVDMAKAKEYLLSDLNDTSKYLSAQCYKDNVMNVALPSTYKFIEKVTTELELMYKEANAELPEIHFGGDELPKGVWEGSPIAINFMRKKNIQDFHSLYEYFLSQLMNMMGKKGIKINGWNEMALKHSDTFNSEFQKHAGLMYCWNTVPEWGDDYVPYHLANKGYDIILSNVTNLYLDLAYRNHPEEIGLHWAGYNNEMSTYSLQPYDIYKSARHMIDGTPIDIKKASDNKESLTENGYLHIKGIQTQLFAEPFRSFDEMTYCIFPKILGAVERSWNAMPSWDDNEDGSFIKSYLTFYKGFVSEMPYWESLGFNYYLPQPGLKVVDGVLYANKRFEEAEIRYTTDGSIPTKESLLWIKPIQISDSISEVNARVFYLSKHSVTTHLIVEK